MTSEEWQWILQDLSLSAVSLKQLKAPEERQERLHCRTLPCSVSAGTAEDLDRHGSSLASQPP